MDKTPSNVSVSKKVQVHTLMYTRRIGAEVKGSWVGNEMEVSREQ